MKDDVVDSSAGIVLKMNKDNVIVLVACLMDVWMLWTMVVVMDILPGVIIHGSGDYSVSWINGDSGEP